MSLGKRLIACAIAGSVVSAPVAFAQNDVPMIDREVLFGNPDRASVQLSPDGKYLSWLAAKDGVLNVWVAPTNDLEAARCVTDDDYRGIRIYGWAHNNTHLFYLQDIGGDENFHVFSTNIDTGKTIELTPFPGARAIPQQVSHKFPNEMLVGVNNRDPRYFDVYKINVETGDREEVFMNTDGYTGLQFDDDFNLRMGSKPQPDASTNWYTFNEAHESELWREVEFEDTLTTGWGGFSKDGSVVYGVDSTGRNTGALTATNLGTGETTILASDTRTDAGGTISHPTENTIQAVQFNYDRRRWEILDDSIREDMAYLATVADGDFSISSRTTDDAHWIVSYVMDDGPVRYYLYDNEANKAKFLFTNRENLEGLPLAKMHPVVIKSRDGLDLVSYYTLPVWTDTDKDAVPDQPLPTVLLVHGGPWGRDSWGYNSRHQWLANRGYAVLSVNFRASTGFGKDFVNAGNMAWGTTMHDDLIDAVDWAIEEGIADANRVGIMGGSYGGYATLAGLTMTPDKFACGVDIVGPSNLNTLLSSIPPYWVAAVERFKKSVGDWTTPEGQEFLKSRSPLTYAGDIKKPLLIGQGANDPRVKQAESDQIVDAMTEKNIPVTYVLFPDEGHGFRRPENSKAFNAVTEGFLHQHLGGRYQPIDDDFEGSTITVPNGADEVPGVSSALGSN